MLSASTPAINIMKRQKTSETSPGRPSKAVSRIETLVTPELREAAQAFADDCARPLSDIMREALAITIGRPELADIRSKGQAGQDKYHGPGNGKRDVKIARALSEDLCRRLKSLDSALTREPA